MSNNAHELSNRLLNALDNNYNVVDMHAVNEIISVLEKINITKELLETTRLGKHVNELRRKTSDPSLARRAKVLVKRWRDLVIPTVASPGHTGSNRSSAERQVRRLGGTPLTSPALTRLVVSPAVPSPRPQSRPAWGGYESDSQDVILVDDDPVPAPAPPPPAFPPLPAHKPLTPPVKRPLSTDPLYDEKKAKRDKKLKKKRGPSRAGSGAEGVPVRADPAPPSIPPPPGGPGVPPVEPWAARNGGAHGDRRRNGYRSHHPLDPYAALAQRMPPTTGKKVKTTKELLEQIQSRGTKPAVSPSSPASPHSPDVMLIEPDLCPLKVESPLRNGGPSPAPPSPARALSPLEDEREYWECTCEALADEDLCPAARRTPVRPLHVRALHHAYLPGVNGTRAPLHPHRFAVRRPDDPDRAGLFTSVVPLYKYSDYADDRCAKNMARVPLCPTLPWTEFAPAPPDPPPPPSPPPPRPYPVDEEPLTTSDSEVKVEPESDCEGLDADTEPVGESDSEPCERLKAPTLAPEEEACGQCEKSEPGVKVEVAEEFATEQRDHRTVERTKDVFDGRMLYEACRHTIERVVYDYGQMATAPVVTLPSEEAEAREVLAGALATAEAEEERDELGRPQRPHNFAEWHECARLGELVALPYVVID